MGQSQSARTPQEGEQGCPGEDLYKLLDVEPNATADEIKKAYRRKALELHPDKNFGNVEEATALFAEVQSAYEVLSDPQERAWYDSHRDAILFGATKAGGGEFFHNSKVTTADDVLAYFAKFNSRIQFTDSPTGFFGGLRELFDQVAREEAFASNLDGQQPVDYPSFGSKDDDHMASREFYSVWSGFATRKSFSWKDVYRYSDAPDRRVRRLMEKENKRIREEAIREFNDAVRSLVAFAKKRDPRYIPTAQSEAERQQQLRESAAAQAARSRAANEAKLRDFTLPEWAQAETVPEDEFSSESEPEAECFVCEICRKYFKSEKQFEAHERSKKHIKAIKEIQRTMRNEDKQFQLHRMPSNDISTTENRVTNDGLAHKAGSAKPGVMDNNKDDDEFSIPSVSDLTGSQTPESDEIASASIEHVDDAVAGDVTSSQARTTSNVASDEEHDLAGMRLQFAETKVTDSAAPQKLGKAKQRRAKKATQKTAGEAFGFKCSTCHASFPSRTKLFNHLREAGHAELLGTRTPAKASKKKSKK